MTSARTEQEHAVLAAVLETVTQSVPAWVRANRHAFIAVDETWADAFGPGHDEYVGGGHCWRVAPSILAADTAVLVAPLPRDDGRFRALAVAEVALPPRRALEVLAGCSTRDAVAVVRAWQSARGAFGYDSAAALGLVRAVLDV